MTPTPPPEFRVARTCYNHLAGVLGVWLHDRLIELGALGPAARDHEDLAGGPSLDAALATLGVEAGAPSRTRRLAYACRDLTERRFHIGGALGARLCGHMLEARWVERMDNSRALRLTDIGWTELTTRLGALPAPTR